MKNTIAVRIADFLKIHPPFHVLRNEELLSIAEEVTVKYQIKGEVLFSQGETCHSYFFLIQQGAVEIFQEEDDREIVLDNCDEGDLFGLRSLFAGDTYTISARTLEECILYLIPIAVFRPVIDRNKKVSEYLLSSLASNTHTHFAKEALTQFQRPLEQQGPNPFELHELQTVSYHKNPVSCSKDTTVRIMANLMNSSQTDAIIVLEDEKPVGMVTDRDIREHIATGYRDVNSPVEEIMSSAVICYPPSITIAQAQLAMMKHRISHLCITTDGTPNTRVIGMVSEHDLIVSEGNNPSFLMKAITRAKKTGELKKIHRNIMLLLKQYTAGNLPMTHISRIMFELNDATIKRCIALSLKKMPAAPPCEFAWMSLGSQGRKEQLLHTDQDNAIIFEDPDPSDLENTRAYFLELARTVNKRLQKLGFEYCPADMMASNPKWCLSLSEWELQFSTWVQSPINEHLLLSQVFFDYDISYGQLSLVNALADHIFQALSDNPYFLANLAKSTIQNPSPRGFFRQFLLETNGEYKDFFDLKKRALIPITDAARLLVLSHKVKNINNTFERYDKLAQLEPQNSELFLGASYATKALLKFRTRQGLEYDSNGRFINLKNLSKEDRIKLKRCFNTIKDLQELIKMRYKLVNFI